VQKYNNQKKQHEFILSSWECTYKILKQMNLKNKLKNKSKKRW
jgi:hypothetical protein